MAKRNAFDELRALFTEIGDATKTAEAMSETGQTAHPIKNVDDGNQRATTGARAAENCDDVKKQVPGESTDSASDASYEASFAKQEGQQFNIGLHPRPAGEAPEVEDNYVGSVKDPGTSSVMTADDGKKYANWNLRKFAANYGPLANQLMSAIVAGDLVTTKTAGARTTSSASAAQAGYNAAAAAGSLDDSLKVAAASLIQDALHAADLTGQYLIAVQKQANDMADQETPAPPPGMDGPGGAPGEMAGGMPPMGDGDGDEMAQLIAMIESLPPDQQQQLLAALAAQGGAPGAGGPGGEPPVEAMSHAMAESGQSPADLEAAASKTAGERADTLRKIASAVRERRQDPQFFHKVATSPAAQRYRDEMKGVLYELLTNR